MLGSIINKALSYQSYSYIIASNHTGGAVEHADEIREIIKHRQVVLDHDDVVVLRSKVSGFGVGFRAQSGARARLKITVRTLRITMRSHGYSEIHHRMVMPRSGFRVSGLAQLLGFRASG